MNINHIFAAENSAKNVILMNIFSTVSSRTRIKDDKVLIGLENLRTRFWNRTLIFGLHPDYMDSTLVLSQ